MTQLARLLMCLASIIAPAISHADVEGIGSLAVLEEIAKGADIRCHACGIYCETLLRELHYKAGGKKLFAEVRYVSNMTNKPIDETDDEIDANTIIPAQAKDARGLLSGPASEVKFPASAVIIDITSPDYPGHTTRYVATATSGDETISGLVFLAANAIANIAKEAKKIYHK